jgi:DNA-binding MarR family transcriptional regulator
MTIISDFLSKLGFGPEAIQLYTSLSQHGPLTLLEASRYSNIERTRLYRLVDELAEKGLVEEVPQYKRRTIKAASISTIEMMVKENELKSKSLTQTLPTFLNALESLTPTLSKNNVVYYHGREGIRQMSWHLLRTKGLYYTYSYRFWDEILGEKFSLSLNEEMRRIKLKVHDIFSDQYFHYKKEWLKTHGHKPGGDWSFWQSRWISEKILKIDQNIDIYNDVVAYYHWQGEETFGVEIYNQRVADFHKQMHDVVWKMAKKTPHFDWTKEWV